MAEGQGEGGEARRGSGGVMRALFIAAALVAAPLTAQAPTAPDAKTLAAARELMAATDLRGQMHAIAPRLADAMGQQFQQMFAGNKMPEGLQAQIAAALQASIASMDSMFTPQVTDQIAAVYARHFTIAELHRLTELQRDPAMVKFRAEMPDAMGEIMPIMLTAVKPQQEALKAKLQHIIADWIKQHPEDKAKLRSPTAS